MVLLFSGCAGPEAITEFPKARIDYRALIDTLAARDQLIESVMGRVSVKVETPTLETRFSADYYFAAPDSFRANIRGILGTRPGALVSIGDSVAAYFPAKETLFVAVGEPEETNPVLGLKMGFGGVVRALIGLTGTGFDYDSIVGFQEQAGIYSLTFTRGDELVHFEVLPSEWVISSMQLFTIDQEALQDVGYYDFVQRGEMVRPSRIVITNPIRGETVNITIEKEIINQPLPDGLFKLPVPEDVAIWKLI